MSLRSWILVILFFWAARVLADDQHALTIKKISVVTPYETVDFSAEPKILKEFYFFIRNSNGTANTQLLRRLPWQELRDRAMVYANGRLNPSEWSVLEKFVWRASLISRDGIEVLFQTLSQSFERHALLSCPDSFASMAETN
ncbi:MAG: hypothetical protein IT289_01185 [Oligoflexia bacterium]|nr:hypothetical protein [Oligoflexia bacterium]